MTFRTFHHPAHDVAANAHTTASIAVGGQYFGTIDKPGDSDWIAVKLVAGVTYTFNLGPGVKSASGPFDTTLGIYDRTGTLLAFNDDAGFTDIFNPGLGGSAGLYDNYSYIQFTPTKTGTYYVAASALDGDVGNYVLSAFAGDLPGGNNTPAVLQVGGASLTSTLDYSGDVDSFKVATVAGEYYTVSITESGDFAQLLAPSIVARDAHGVVLGDGVNYGYLTVQLTFEATASTTWLDVSSDFPGFDIGQYTVEVEKASVVDAVESNWPLPPTPTNIKVYFAGVANITDGNGESFATAAWTSSQIGQALRLFQGYSAVANVAFTVVDDPAEADLVIAQRIGSGSTSELSGEGLSALPTEINGTIYNTALVEIVVTTPELTDGDFAPGTFGNHVLSHEIGHVLGLTHPHDDGSSSAAVPGAFFGGYQSGAFELDQGVYTEMSYLAGFSEKDGLSQSNGLAIPLINVSPEFGAPEGPMAVDIAALQELYGANTTTATGNNTYVLPDANGLGTGYVAIWDNGGTDTIAAAATDTRGVTIDLRAATLDYDSIGGGAVSWARGVAGGFTIANGAVIENATGAAGEDLLIGNDVANQLSGGAGNDQLAGGGGDDRLFGGAGNDQLYGDVLPGHATGIGFGSGFIINAAGAHNNTAATAQNLTNAFALFNTPDVADSATVPHVTIKGTGDGSVDWFKITLAKGAIVTFDMDHTTGGLDGAIQVEDSNLNPLALFDSGASYQGGGGSTSTLDPYGTFTAWDGGTYYFLVGDNTNVAAGVSTDITMAPGKNYVLNVSVASMTDAIGSGTGNDYLDGGDGDDYLDSSAGDDRLLGGAGNDRLQGGSGNDYLDGGSGNNWLEGGSGNDSFYFGDPLSLGNVGTIADFSHHDDQILLDHHVFAGLATGALSSSAFDVIGPGSRVDSSDRILYNAQTGDLSFDQDGSGAAYKAIRFANIDNRATLSASDFLVV